MTRPKVNSVEFVLVHFDDEAETCGWIAAVSVIPKFSFKVPGELLGKRVKVKWQKSVLDHDGLYDATIKAVGGDAKELLSKAKEIKMKVKGVVPTPLPSSPLSKVPAEEDTSSGTSGMSRRRSSTAKSASNQYRLAKKTDPQSSNQAREKIPSKKVSSKPKQKCDEKSTKEFNKQLTDALGNPLLKGLSERFYEPFDETDSGEDTPDETEVLEQQNKELMKRLAAMEKEMQGLREKSLKTCDKVGNSATFNTEPVGDAGIFIFQENTCSIPLNPVGNTNVEVVNSFNDPSWSSMTSPLFFSHQTLCNAEETCKISKEKTPQPEKLVRSPSSVAPTKSNSNKVENNSFLITDNVRLNVDFPRHDDCMLEGTSKGSSSCIGTCDGDKEATEKEKKRRQDLYSDDIVNEVSKKVRDHILKKSCLETDDEGYVNLGFGVKVQREEFENNLVKQQKSTLYLRNLATEVWGRNKLARRSIHGMKSNKFKNVEPKLKATPDKMSVFLGVYHAKMSMDGDEPKGIVRKNLFENALSNLTKKMSDESTRLKKDSKKAMDILTRK